MSIRVVLVSFLLILDIFHTVEQTNADMNETVSL